MISSNIWRTHCSLLLNLIGCISPPSPLFLPLTLSPSNQHVCVCESMVSNSAKVSRKLENKHHKRLQRWLNVCVRESACDCASVRVRVWESWRDREEVEVIEANQVGGKSRRWGFESLRQNPGKRLRRRRRRRRYRFVFLTSFVVRKKNRKLKNSFVSKPAFDFAKFCYLFWTR